VNESTNPERKEYSIQLEEKRRGLLGFGIGKKKKENCVKEGAQRRERSRFFGAD